MSALIARQQDARVLRQVAQTATLSPQTTGAVWLGIHFPDIALEAQQIPPDTPFAILASLQGRSCIYRANTLAAAQGIEPGMPLNAAYVLCKNLAVNTRDDTAEAACLAHYAQLSAHLTPQIVLSSPDVLMLDVKKSLALFGGLKSIHQQLTHAIKTPHTIACAPVERAAELMARNGIGRVVRNPAQLRSALGDIPIHAAQLEAKLVARLLRCGLHTLRDLWRLPRHALARRFGPQLLDYLDQLSGEVIRPRILFEPGKAFKAQHDFEQETESSEQLLRAGEYLLTQAQQFLQQRASLCERIRFRLIYTHRQFEAKEWLELNVHAQQGGDTPAHFLPQMTEQLQHLELKQAVITLALRIDHFKPRFDDTRDLFRKTAPAMQDWPALLDLLCARLGFERIYRLQGMADHRPEKSWRKIRKLMPKKTRQQSPDIATRPVWLFSPPIRCLEQRYKLISDAERLEAGWWDQQDLRREYYQGLAPSGRRCWLFRDLASANGQWYVHGLFA